MPDRDCKIARSQHSVEQLIHAEAVRLDASLRSVPELLSRSGKKLRRAVKDKALASVALQRLLETGQVIEFKYKKQWLCLHSAHFGRPSGQNQRFSRGSFDWMTTFIEENISTRVDTLRRAFQREYSEVYAAWADDPIHSKSPAEYDTNRCWRMVEIADKHLEQIARNYPRRFLIKLLRTLPLENVKRITLQGRRGPHHVHDRLKPLLLKLKERFSQIPLKVVFKLRGGYAIRWYEMLVAKKHLGSFSMDVEELRAWLGIGEGELSAVKDLRKRAIDVSKAELDNKADLTFRYEPIKAGRRITGWKFKVKENRPRPVQRQSPLRVESEPSPEEAEKARAVRQAALEELKQKLRG